VLLLRASEAMTPTYSHYEPDLGVDAVARLLVRQETSREDTSRQVILHACLLTPEKASHVEDEIQVSARCRITAGRV
jgi:hypothetical protein